MIDIAALFVAYLLSQFYRAFLAVLSPVLIDELGVSATDLSRAAGVWFAAFALMQIPAGVALDRAGPRLLTALGLLLGAGGGALVFAAAEGAAALTLAMGMIGAGCAPLLMSGMFLFARRFEAARFATLSGLMIAFGSLGNVLGAAPFAWAVEALGWRAAMLWLAALAVALAVMLWALVRDPPRIEAAPVRRAFAGYAELMRMRTLWFILPLALTNYAAMAGVRGLWAGPWLAEVHGLSAVEVGTALLWMALAMTAGSALYGPLDRWLGTRKWVLFWGNGAGMLVCAALAFGAPGTGAAVALLAGLGLFGSSYAVLTAHFRAFAPMRLTGRAVTLLNVFGIGGAALGQFATGALFELRIEAGAGAEEAYATVFAWYALTLGAALAAYLFSRDAKP